MVSERQLERRVNNLDDTPDTDGGPEHEMTITNYGVDEDGELADEPFSVIHAWRDENDTHRSERLAKRNGDDVTQTWREAAGYDE